MDILRKIRKIIDTVDEYIAKVAKYALVIIAISLTFEVVARYIFHSPTIWAQDISKQALCIIGALGGSYALLYNNHVKVDVFWGNWSPKVRGIVDICTSVMFLVFVGILIIKSTEMAMDSWMYLERATTVFAPPLYYIKTLIPIGAVLMLLQGISKLIHDIIAVITGESENLKEMEY